MPALLPTTLTPATYLASFKTIAGDDTIFMVVKEGIAREDVIEQLSAVIPDIKQPNHHG